MKQTIMTYLLPKRPVAHCATKRALNLYSLKELQCVLVANSFNLCNIYLVLLTIISVIQIDTDTNRLLHL